MIRILLVDDQDTIRRGLRMRLELEDDFQVVGEAGDGHAALAEATRLQPDVVVMDVAMPALDGIAAGSLIREQSPGIGLVVLTLYDSFYFREQAKGVGATFVSKHESDSGLLPAIRRAATKGEKSV